MEFGSIVFLLRFMPIFFILYYLVPGRMKNIVLLLGSFCFYAWGAPLYLLPMAFSACSDFIIARLIEKYRGKGTAKVLLFSALTFDMTLLFVFGYADFFIETANLLWGLNLEKLGFTMPVGITIYTLQTMSYVVDVWRGKCKPAGNLLEYATFVAMFPQLSAGPILRYVDVRDSLRDRKMEIGQVSTGAKRICVGLAKMILISDASGVLWSNILEMRPIGISTATAWLGLMAYAFRIYFAFSGCADVAIGLGACMGFYLPENFDHPFISSSISDFVRRWNVSLTKWMKEYFYNSIVSGKKTFLQKTFWVLITWCLIGLWYGPDWTFVLWGLWISIFYVLEKLFLGKLLRFLPRIVGWCYAMLVISLGWLLLAMNDVSDAIIYFQALFGKGGCGLIDRRFLFIVMENLPLLALAVFSCLPVFSGAIKKLAAGRNGMAIALTRLLEKVYPPLCLLASLVYLIGRGY